MMRLLFLTKGGLMLIACVGQGKWGFFWGSESRRELFSMKKGGNLRWNSFPLLSGLVC